MYAAMTKDEGNAAKGHFSAACEFFQCFFIDLVGPWVEEDKPGLPDFRMDPQVVHDGS